MTRPLELERMVRCVSLAIGAILLCGCGSAPVATGSNNGVDNGNDTDATGTSTAQTFESPGGTSDLGMGADDGGAATLKSFDPGAFLRTAKTVDATDGDLLNTAQFDGPPPPPPADTGAPPPPPADTGAPPPADPGGPPPADPNAPPPDGSIASPPPADGTDPNFPPPGGTDPNFPPPDGTDPNFPPPDGTDPNFPPPDGTDPNFPPPDGTDPNFPPPDGTDPNFPPPSGTDGNFPPPNGFDPNSPPPDGFDPNAPPPDDFFFPPPDGFDGTLPPPPAGFGPGDGFMPPPAGFENGGTFSVPPPPDGFVGDGGFFAPPDGFDANGVFFVPPEGVVGDAIFLPPPPEGFDEDGFFFPPSEGTPGAGGFVAPPDFFQVYQDFPPPPPDFVGDWQPPPPQEWDGASDWMPPPADDLYADGAWFPPPPPQGWQGEWFPPPPPPEGVVEFPGEFFFSDKFDEFFTDDFFVGEGFDAGPPPFEAFPFDAFLQDHELHEIIPGTPPQFVHGAFGDFDFGAVPPRPPGFAAFPLPPEFLAGFGDFGAAFGPPRLPGDAPGGDGSGPPPDLPPEFFQFQERLADLQTFLQDFPPPPADGTVGPGDGPFPPGDGPVGGAPSDQLAFLGFDDIADFLPDDFLPPDQVAEKFSAFGQDHPLIGEGGVVNPELETAMLDHPPVPEGFDGFDFTGDQAQFDDMFSVYDENNVGATQRGQVNSTLNGVLDDGTKLRCSDTTVLETVQGEAMPLVEMEPGVYQTQWVVNIRQLTTTVMQLEDPLDPNIVTDADQSREVLSQMTWTMLMQEVDTDGDGIPDEMRMSGSNSLQVLSDTIEGGPPAGFPPLPTPPPMVLGLDFEGVLDMNPSAP